VVASQPSVSEPALAELEACLRQLLADCQPPGTSPPARGRPPILPALVLWTGLVVCILRGWSSQRELWRLLSSGRFWDAPAYAIEDQAVYHRLARAGTAPLEQLFAQLSARLAERLTPLVASEALAPFATQVVALDETALDPVARTLPSLRGLPTEATIPGKLAGRFDLRLQQWQTIQFCPDYRQNERVLARALVADLPPTSLVLCDLGYFGFEWFDDLTSAELYWLSRLREKTSYTIVHTFYRDGEVLDALVWLGAYRADRARYLVRLVAFPHGQQVRRYITNVSDPGLLSIAEIARLYARRWDIEMAVQLVKEHLGLGLLWSSKPVVIQQQVWAVLIIAQLIQALRLEAAARAGVDLFDVSLPLLVRYLPRYAAWGHDPLAAFLEDGERLGFIRPSRRVQVSAPLPALSAYVWPPPDLVDEREPRYARRKC
jgi:hypothetical protein